MLSHLTVDNFAIARRLELEFERNMTVITGETGAGKSIMLDALGLALGNRGDSNAIGANGPRLEVAATFELADGSAHASIRHWLNERELVDGDATDNLATEVILRRTVNREGRSSAFINGTRTSVNELRTLGNMLIDLHSQHEHHSLLRRDTHLHLLDAFAGASKEAEAVARVYAQHQELTARLDKLIEGDDSHAARVQLLQFQAEELAAKAVAANEAEVLADEQKRLSSADTMIATCAEALTALDADDNNLGQTLAQVINRLTTIDGELGPVIDLLKSGQIQIEEATADLRHFTDHLEEDPVRLRAVEERLSTIYELARKYQVQPEQLPGRKDEIDAELERMSNLQADVAALNQERDDAETRWHKAARKLGKKRLAAAARLDAAVSAQLVAMGMDKTVFETRIDPTTAFARHGSERAEFQISTNPGQPLQALGRIASGGELSRISLAIQVVVSETSPVPTLVFDEVDVGIGGAVAEVVGQLLRRLANHTQILCVTHLPQVASQGEHHLQVSKETGSGATQVCNLAGAERVDEIARMLGGIEMTDESVAHARAMLAGSGG